MICTSLSEILIKVIGIVLAIVGVALLLSVVGINVFGIGFSPVWAEFLIGVVFLGTGIVIIRGGNITL